MLKSGQKLGITGMGVWFFAWDCIEVRQKTAPENCARKLCQKIAPERPIKHYLQCFWGDDALNILHVLVG